MNERTIHVWSQRLSATRELVIVALASDGKPPTPVIALDKDSAAELAQLLLDHADRIAPSTPPPPPMQMPRRLV